MTANNSIHTTALSRMMLDAFPPLFRCRKTAMMRSDQKRSRCASERFQMNNHELLTIQAKKNIESHPCNGAIAPGYGQQG